MRKLVWLFLNTKYEGKIIYHQLFNLSDKLLEKFVSDKGEVIIQFSRFHSGKETRTRVNIFLKAVIKKYFDIHDIDLAIVNGMRRIIMTDIPNLGAIGEKLEKEEPTVSVITNTGALHDEFIIHRIGLIPICMTADEIENYEDNSLVIELNVNNTTNKSIDVRTSDFKATFNDVEITEKKLRELFPQNKVSKHNILITRLRPGEHLHLKANIVKRTGRDNASFNPVSLSNFSYIQDPKEAKKYESLLDKERAYYMNEYGDPTKFKFDIEHINVNMGPRYLIPKSLDIVINKLNNLMTELVNINTTEIVKIQQFQDIAETYEFIIDNEDDTLGNIIQSYVHDNYVRNKKTVNNMACKFIGYICPHPLKSTMIIRITLDNITDKYMFIAFMDKVCKEIVSYLVDIKTKWNKFAIDNNVS
jgi:DNA-directed RNA polymerase alpha subunit